MHRILFELVSDWAEPLGSSAPLLWLMVNKRLLQHIGIVDCRDGSILLRLEAFLAASRRTCHVASGQAVYLT